MLSVENSLCLAAPPPLRLFLAPSSKSNPSPDASPSLRLPKLAAMRSRLRPLSTLRCRPARLRFEGATLNRGEGYTRGESSGKAEGAREDASS